jgi:hypothetical protein
VADAREQVLPGGRQPGTLGIGASERHHHRVEGIGRDTHLVGARDAGAHRQVTLGDVGGDLAEPPQVAGQRAGQLAADDERDPRRHEQHHQEEPVVVRRDEHGVRCGRRRHRPEGQRAQRHGEGDTGDAGSARHPSGKQRCDRDGEHCRPGDDQPEVRAIFGGRLQQHLGQRDGHDHQRGQARDQSAAHGSNR